METVSQTDCHRRCICKNFEQPRSITIECTKLNYAVLSPTFYGT